MENDRYSQEYEALLDFLHRYCDITPRTIAAMRTWPRALFLPPELQDQAAENKIIPLPGYEGKSSNSQPSTVGRMLDMLKIQPSQRVLDIGTGSGNVPALESALGGIVTSAEIEDPLATAAGDLLAKLGVKNVEIIVDDGTELRSLLDTKRTWNKILVNGSLPPRTDHALFGYLVENGRMVVPIGGLDGDTGKCQLIRIVKRDGRVRFDGPDAIDPEKYRFVELQGSYGWNSVPWRGREIKKNYYSFMEALRSAEGIPVA